MEVPPGKAAFPYHYHLVASPTFRELTAVDRRGRPLHFRRSRTSTTWSKDCKSWEGALFQLYVVLAACICFHFEMEIVFDIERFNVFVIQKNL